MFKPNYYTKRRKPSTMSDLWSVAGAQKLSLPFLQGKIKRLPDGCETELQLIYKQFKASVDLFQQQAALSISSVRGIGSDPSVAKDLGNRAMFLAHVTRFYRKKLAEFPAQMTDLLRTSCLRDALRAEEPCPKQTSFHPLLQPSSSSLITAAITNHRMMSDCKVAASNDLHISLGQVLHLYYTNHFAFGTKSIFSWIERISHCVSAQLICSILD
ncbi:hypothetical protein Bca52824_026384 [Brassica carinata]|uniref:Protein SDA1 n=1 Tax=Brassica carinata TaxID=52824 RepID=A0A8X7VAA0_BRACI|nr:hypothetical protein Bca52824_026384 [Brassica carinata]